MQPAKLYIYGPCSTCRKARAWLDERGLAYKPVPIRETPPSAAELQRLLASAASRTAILNTSSADYREPGVKEKLAAMSDGELCEFLSRHGNLVKRPVWIDSKTTMAGFHEARWGAALQG